MHKIIGRYWLASIFVTGALLFGCASSDGEGTGGSDDPIDLAIGDSRDSVAHDESGESSPGDEALQDGIVDNQDAEDPAADDDAEIEEVAEDDAPWNDPSPDGVEPAPDNLAPATLSPLAKKPLLRSGLHPRASDALRAIKVPAWRITQTIGSAAASAGTHARDGYANGRAYSAATDLSVRGLTHSSIRRLLAALAANGFGAWYRRPGYDGWPRSEAPHIHAVYTGCRMKASLRSQIRSWLAGRNGLRSNSIYRFYTWSAASKKRVRTLFNKYN